MTTAAILTVGDELLTGDVKNSNAMWLAAQLSDRGVDVREHRVVPDEVGVIAQALRELSQEHTYVVTTGGLGSTPDDVTTAAVAKALEQSLEAHSRAKELIEATVETIREDNPDFTHDVDTACRFPAEAQVLNNPEGIAPGFVCGNLYVLPGIPVETKAVFRQVADEFHGDFRSRTYHADLTENELGRILERVHAKFDVHVGCYPTGKHKRIKLVGDDEADLSGAAEWLGERVDIDPIDATE